LPGGLRRLGQTDLVLQFAEVPALTVDFGERAGQEPHGRRRDQDGRHRDQSWGEGQARHSEMLIAKWLIAEVNAQGRRGSVSQRGRVPVSDWQLAIANWQCSRSLEV
jgi:hypothetical protein